MVCRAELYSSANLDVLANTDVYIDSCVNCSG